MTQHPFARLVVLMVAAFAVGCGDDEPDAPDAAAANDASPPPDAEPACGAGEVRWAMTLHDGRGGPALKGVHACILDDANTPCIDTAADGAWAPCVPANQDVAFTFEKEGFLSLIYPIRTGATPPTQERFTDIVLFDLETAGALWNQFGVEFPPTSQGLLWLDTQVDNPGSSWFPGCLGDVSVAFSPAADGGPFYRDASGNYDPSATATLGVFCNAWAAFTPGVDPIATLSHPSLTTCNHLEGGWAGDDPNTVVPPIRAGFRTYMAVSCH